MRRKHIFSFKFFSPIPLTLIRFGLDEGSVLSQIFNDFRLCHWFPRLQEVCCSLCCNINIHRGLFRVGGGFYRILQLAACFSPSWGTWILSLSLIGLQGLTLDMSAGGSLLVLRQHQPHRIRMFLRKQWQTMLSHAPSIHTTHRRHFFVSFCFLLSLCKSERKNYSWVNPFSSEYLFLHRFTPLSSNKLYLPPYTMPTKLLRSLL